MIPVTMDDEVISGIPWLDENLQRVQTLEVIFSRTIDIVEPKEQLPSDTKFTEMEKV